MSDTPYQPLKGDPELLLQKANHYLDIAEAIQRSAATLKKIHDVDDMKSEATEALKDSSESVRNDITKAHDRYSVTANALIGYSSALRQAQHDAAAAITDINNKQGDVDTAQRHASAATEAAHDAHPDDKTSANQKVQKAQDGVTAANAALEAAQKRWHEAVDAKTLAAKTAHDAIVYVVDKHNNGLHNPGFWSRLGHAITSIAGKLYEALKVVCKWAGVLSIFLSWVPGLGEVLVALAALGAVLDLIEATINLIEGKGSWGDLLFAAGGAVLAVFGGKMIEMAGKGIKGVMVARAADRIASTGERGTAALGRLQGVGSHSADFMSSTAANAAKSEMKEAFSSMRGFGKAVGNSFKNSMNPAREGDSMAKIFSSSIKDSFTPSGLVNSDLASAVKMAIKHPSLLDTKLVLAGAAVTGAKVTQDVIEVHDQVDSQPVPGVGGGYGTVAGVPDLVHETVDAAKSFG